MYYIKYDECMNLSSPLPGLHFGLDSFRFSTIVCEKLIFHCWLDSTASSVTLHFGLLPNAALCVVLRGLLQCGAPSARLQFGLEIRDFTNQRGLVSMISYLSQCLFR